MRLARPGRRLAALPLGVGGERRRRPRARPGRPPAGPERALEPREEALRRFRERSDDRLDRLDDLDGAFRLDDFGTGPALRLFRVVDVNGDDFDRGSDPQNRDALTWGAIRLDRENSADARIQVSLDGAANATYEVVFVGIRDNRIGLGWVRTNNNGDFDGYSRSNQDNTGDPGASGGQPGRGLRPHPGRTGPVRHRPGHPPGLGQRSERHALGLSPPLSGPPRLPVSPSPRLPVSLVPVAPRILKDGTDRGC